MIHLIILKKMAEEDIKMALEGKKMERDFSRVIITLDNILIPDDKLNPSPSVIDGLSHEAELDLRIYGCELIQTAGILLNLPQVAMATGQVLFQRFYYSKSFVKHNVEVVAMACVNLASKIEEAPRRIRDVVNIFHHVKQFRNKKNISPLVLDQNYINLKNQVIKAERRILKELGFCVHVKHPHKIVVMYLQVLEAHRNQRLVQCAWNYMNDSFRTNVFVRFNPESIACACIYLAARQLQIPLPNSPHWFLLFGMVEGDLKEISISILQLYTRKKPNIEELDRMVNEIKKEQIEAKLKAKELSLNAAASSMASLTATPEKSNASPVVPLSIRNAIAENEKPTTTLGEELSRLARSTKKQDFSRSRTRRTHQNDRRSRSSRSSSSSNRSPKLKPSSQLKYGNYTSHHKMDSQWKKTDGKTWPSKYKLSDKEVDPYSKQHRYKYAEKLYARSKHSRSNDYSDVKRSKAEISPLVKRSRPVDSPIAKKSRSDDSPIMIKRPRNDTSPLVKRSRQVDSPKRSYSDVHERHSKKKKKKPTSDGSPVQTKSESKKHNGHNRHTHSLDRHNAFSHR